MLIVNLCKKGIDFRILTQLNFVNGCELGNNRYLASA